MSNCKGFAYLIIYSAHNIIRRFRETGEISVRKEQGRIPLLDVCDLRAPLRRHYITHRHDSVIDITKWAQEYFQKSLSVNTIRCAICRCQLMLYHAKRKPYVNMVQKRRCVLSTVSKLKSVLWSDESKFDILVGNHGHCVLWGARAPALLSSDAKVPFRSGLCDMNNIVDDSNQYHRRGGGSIPVAKIKS